MYKTLEKLIINQKERLFLKVLFQKTRCPIKIKLSVTLKAQKLLSISKTADFDSLD